MKTALPARYSATISLHNFDTCLHTAPVTCYEQAGQEISKTNQAGTLHTLLITIPVASSPQEFQAGT